MKKTFSPKNQKIIEQLEGLKSINVKYPSKLLNKRRAAFIRQIEARERIESKEASLLDNKDVTSMMKQAFSSKNQRIVEQLEGLRSINVKYPSKLLNKRRTAFIRQVEARERIESKEVSLLDNKDLTSILKSFGSHRTEYPPQLLARRRLIYKLQLMRHVSLRWWETTRSNIRSSLTGASTTLKTPAREFIRASFVVVSMILAVYLGIFVNGRNDQQLVSSNVAPTRMGEFLSILATSTPDWGEISCKPGHTRPFCVAKKIENEEVLSFQGNGLARAAVAKDTNQTLSGVHQPSFANDGLYGSGASWISEAAYSWIKIDLGTTMPINTIHFGKDRLGNINGHNPGQFTISVALTDNVYADGDSSNDTNEYKQVYDSNASGFSGVISGSETVQATFEPVYARFIKITVTNPSAAIDEVEVFFFTEPTASVALGRTKEPLDARSTDTSTPTLTRTPSRTPTNTASATNTSTKTPTNTATSTITPSRTPTRTTTSTNTPVPTSTSTFTPVPTNTPLPTSTSTPVPTNTPLTTSTSTPIPTSTPLTINTSTSLPNTVIP